MDNETYGLMQTGTPYKSYIKTIVGKVYVSILNPFDESKVEGVILKGNPNTLDDSCVVDVWNEKGDVYFKRANKKNFDMGFLIEHKRKEKEPTEEELLNRMSDEDVVKLLNSKFFTLKSKINKMNSVAPLFRTLEKAKEMEKSEKIIKVIEEKISKVQLEAYELPKEKSEEEED
jgi:hypothetical protein